MEAASEGIDVTFAPMLDISRDPRWGRIVEGPGEDPFVAARFAEAKVRGFQGQSLADRSSVAATAKHFCGGGAARAGRDYAEVDLSDRELQEIYLPPFRAAVAAGCAAIMPAFNSVAGFPMTAHIATPTANAGQNGTPALSMSAMLIGMIAKTEPTERSNSPQIISIAKPIVTAPTSGRSPSTPLMF